MKYHLIIGLCLILLSVTYTFAGNFGIDLTLNLNAGSGGEGGSPPGECVGAYDALTGSDSNVIHDSEGNPICCPQ